MKTWFYDNTMERNAKNPQFITIERVYCINELEFTQKDYETLNEIMRALPGGFRSGVDGLPYWFGMDEENPPYLWASMEAPFGLQVGGTLKEEDWLAWDLGFQKSAQQLPHYEIDTEDAAFQPENKHRPKVIYWDIPKSEP